LLREGFYFDRPFVPTMRRFPGYRVTWGSTAEKVKGQADSGFSGV
jgi:hypothetical protein